MYDIYDMLPCLNLKSMLFMTVSIQDGVRNRLRN